MPTVTFTPLTPPHARAVIGWRYEPPYDVYNLHVADVATEAAYMADPSNHYYSITQGADLIGHAVFYHEARVPGGDYRADALDVGWGLHPDMTGRGVGTEIVAQIMAFGRTQYGARRFRATVAAWNARGLKVCTNNGFSQADRFHHLHTGREFVILMTGQ